MAERSRRSRILDSADDLPRAFVRDTGDPQANEGEVAIGEAYARGRADAEREAAAKLEQELTRVRGEIAAALENMSELTETMNREHQALMRELALEAASRIVREKIADDDPVAARALAQAVEALPPGDEIRARLHPEDVTAVERELAGLIERRRLELCPDASLSRGGCVVESAAGTIDATIETAEREIRLAAHGGGDES